jgi:hypothetical protein
MLSSGIGAARFQTPDKLQRRFELAPELLFLFSAGHLQARHARHGIPHEVLSDRTNQAFAFWADPEPELGARLKRLSLPAGTWLPWSPGDRVASVLAEHLPSYDAYAQSQAVRGEQRFGRDALLASLQRDLEAHDAVGVYGLRKIGKTSLVYGLGERHALSEAVSGESGWRVVYADAQYFLDEGEGIPALCDRLSEGFDKRRSVRTVRDFRRMLEAEIHRGATPCLIVDEFDWLITHESYKSKIVEFLAMVRGLVQTFPGRSKWVFVGREPSLLNGPRLYGFPNPMLNFWRPFWVPPLSREDAGELLRVLGRRMGLDVGHLSKKQSYRLTYGHPHLTRLYGSQLARLTAAGPHADPERNRPTDPYAESACKVFLRSDEVKNWSVEVFDLLDGFHASAGALLTTLAGSRDLLGDWQAAQEIHDDEARLLESFGLVEGTSGEVPEVLRTHVARYRTRGAA